jgi:hypothetical protein
VPATFAFAALLFVGATCLAAPAISEFERALSGLALPGEAEIRQAFEAGFSQNRVEVEEALLLVEGLSHAPGNGAERQGILLVVAGALRDGLPASMLISKACEGLARGVPLSSIEQGIAQRARLEVEARDLLYGKRIFSAPAEAAAPPGVLPSARFDALVSEIADALADYLEGGGSPLEGYLLLDAVTLRLTRLSGTALPPQDVSLVLARIEAGDLTSVVLNALDQPKK